MDPYVLASYKPAYIALQFLIKGIWSGHATITDHRPTHCRNKRHRTQQPWAVRIQLKRNNQPTLSLSISLSELSELENTLRITVQKYDPTRNPNTHRSNNKPLYNNKIIIERTTVEVNTEDRGLKYIFAPLLLLLLRIKMILGVSSP